MAVQGGIQFTDTQFNQLIQQLSSNNKSSLTTIIAENSLPKFRGRRRENEKHFDTSQTFSEFIDLVNAHIASQNIKTDEEKINFLLICADQNVGDFYGIIRQYKNQAQFAGSSYDDIVNHLKAIYATNKEKTLIESNKEIILEGTKVLNSRNLIPSRLNAFHTAQENSIKFYLESETVPFPERNQGETDNEFFVRRDKFKAELIRDFNLKLFFGTKFTHSINSKIFNPTEMHNRDYKDTILKLYEVLRETPSTTPVFNDESKMKESTNKTNKTYVVKTPSKSEYEVLDSYECCLDSTNHNDCHASYSTHHRGHNRFSHRDYPGTSGCFSRPFHGRRSVSESHRSHSGRGTIGRGYHVSNHASNFDGKHLPHAFRNYSGYSKVGDRNLHGNYKNKSRYKDRCQPLRKYSTVNYQKKSSTNNINKVSEVKPRNNQ